MSGKDTKVASHHLSIHPFSKPVAQRKKKVGEEKRAAIDENMGKLSEVEFIIETNYPTWLANKVLA